MEQKTVAKFCPNRRRLDSMITKDISMLELLDIPFRVDKSNYRIITEKVIFRYYTPERTNRLRGCKFDAVFMDELNHSERDIVREVLFSRSGKIYG